jgi:ankyrin repeat protein
LQQDPNETDPSKDCFLRWSFFSLASAVVNNNWGVFCTLLDIGVDPNTINPSPTAAADTFFTATMLAATTYNPLMLTAALAFGARTQTRIPFPDARTALHLACGKYQSTVASVDEDDIDMIRQWSFSRTEVSPEDFQVMQNMSIWALLQHGAAIEAQDYHGYTSLAYAIAECPDLFAAKILLELNPPANINAANFSGNTVLHEAVREGDLKRLEFCFNNGANLEQKTEMGETALAVAAKEGNIDICQQLLLAGASIKERDANGQNCLNLALQKAQFEILAIFEDSALRESTHALVRLILDEDCRGWTGLHTCIMLSPADDRFIAILERWLDVVGDIDLDHQDLLGWTLLHTAVASSEACARILLERGATIDIKDSLLGWTPLHHACNEGNADMWNLLLEFGADPYISDDLMGWTPMVVLEQAVDQARLDESEVFESIARERQARRRVRLRERATRLFTEKSLGRMVRPMIQADLEWKEEANRREAFPDEPFLAGSGAAESFREQRRYFLMDNEGSCKEWGLIVPSQPIKRSRSWQVHEG